jgi:hypothetical protein
MGTRRTLRETFGWIYLLATGIPLLLLGAWGLFHALGEWNTERERLAETVALAREELDHQIDMHLNVALTVARELELGGVGVGAAAGPWLDRTRQHTPGFLSMAVADRSGRVVASSPAAAVGTSVADRAYFTRVAAGAPWTVSDAFRGRVLGNNPIAAISAAVRDERGEFAGIVQGSLRLQGFSELERRHASVDALRIVVLDAAGAVVYGGRDSRFEPLLALPKELPPTIEAGFTFRDPADGRRWLVARAASGEWGWQVLAMQPVAAVLANVRGSLIGFAVAVSWSLIVMVIGLRRVLTHAVVPVERLAAAMRDFRLTEPPPHLELQPGTPAEIVELTRTFEAMSERTRRVITGLVPICAECKRIRDAQGNWEPVESYVSNRSEAEFTHGMCPECAVNLGFPPIRPVRETTAAVP